MLGDITEPGSQLIWNRSAKPAVNILESIAASESPAKGDAGFAFGLIRQWSTPENADRKSDLLQAIRIIEKLLPTPSQPALCEACKAGNHSYHDTSVYRLGCQNDPPVGKSACECNQPAQELDYPTLRYPASTSEWKIPYDGKGMYFATEMDAYIAALKRRIATAETGLRDEQQKTLSCVHCQRKDDGAPCPGRTGRFSPLPHVFGAKTQAAQGVQTVEYGTHAISGISGICFGCKQYSEDIRTSRCPGNPVYTIAQEMKIPARPKTGYRNSIGGWRYAENQCNYLARDVDPYIAALEQRIKELEAAK